uniref:Uncharacterized protein n=1 Tax=Gopherus agassizii TaxID=38772 RepID=A0A452HMA6_9SAUR
MHFSVPQLPEDLVAVRSREVPLYCNSQTCIVGWRFLTEGIFISFPCPCAALEPRVALVPGSSGCGITAHITTKTPSPKSSILQATILDAVEKSKYLPFIHEKQEMVLQSHLCFLFHSLAMPCVQGVENLPTESNKGCLQLV